MDVLINPVIDQISLIKSPDPKDFLPSTPTIDLSSSSSPEADAQGPQPRPLTMEALIVTRDGHPILFQQSTTLDQQLPIEQDIGRIVQDDIIPVVDVEAQIDLGRLSIQGSMGVELGLTGRTNHQISRPEPNNTGMLGYVVDQTLGPNRSDPIWWLRLLAAATVGVVFFPGYLHGVHATYRRMMLMMTVGAPIVVAVFTLLLSFHLASDPNKRNWNWITGLSVANLSMLVGPLAVYWALQWGTGN